MMQCGCEFLVLKFVRQNEKAKFLCSWYPLLSLPSMKPRFLDHPNYSDWICSSGRSPVFLFLLRLVLSPFLSPISSPFSPSFPFHLFFLLQLLLLCLIRLPFLTFFFSVSSPGFLLLISPSPSFLTTSPPPSPYFRILPFFLSSSPDLLLLNPPFLLLFLLYLFLPFFSSSFPFFPCLPLFFFFQYPSVPLLHALADTAARPHACSRTRLQRFFPFDRVLLTLEDICLINIHSLAQFSSFLALSPWHCVLMKRKCPHIRQMAPCTYSPVAIL